MGDSEEIENRLRADVKSNPAWASLEAVRNNKVYLLPERLFLFNPGLHYPDAVKNTWLKLYIQRFLRMTNNQADTLERIERFGISRTAWRLSVMAAFAMLAFLGAFLSLTKGSADISLACVSLIFYLIQH